MRQPGRVRLLAGKVLALVSFITIAVVIAVVAAALTALAIAPGNDISISAWFHRRRVGRPRRASLLLAVYGVLAVTAGATLFARRDVTTWRLR